jgi:lipoate synthase
VPALNEDQKYEAVKFVKEWQTYRQNQSKIEFNALTRAVKAQERALKELKRDNFNLYEQAIQIDYNLIPYIREGPSYTSSISEKAFEPPEGDYLDVTFLYDKK